MQRKFIVTILILVTLTIQGLLVKTMLNMTSGHDCPLSVLMTGECMANSTPAEILAFHERLITTVQNATIMFSVVLLAVAIWFYSKNNEVLLSVVEFEAYFIKKWKLVRFRVHRRIYRWFSCYFRVPRLNFGRF